MTVLIQIKANNIMYGKTRWKVIFLLVQITIRLTACLNITRPSTSKERDSFSNRNCDWTNCSKYSSACTTAGCCQCTCDTGRTFVTLNNSCMAEKQIATDCTFMAQISSLIPWSFVPITITNTDSLVAGLNIFNCERFGCKKGEKCNITSTAYENNGWKEFPSSSESELNVEENLLKVKGKQCNNERFEGLLMKLTLVCAIQNLQTELKKSCMVMKIAGTYSFGEVPVIGSKCSNKQLIKSITMNSSQTLSSFSLVTEPLSNTTTTRKVLLNYKTSYLATATTKTTTSLQPSFIQHRSKKLATMTSGLEQASLFVSPYQETQTSVWPVVSTGKGHTKLVTQSSNVITMQPSNNRANDDKNSNDKQYDIYLLTSSIIAAVAIFCIILLVVVLLLLRRNKDRTKRTLHRAKDQRISVDQQILKHRRIQSGRSPPQSTPPLPPILKLRSIESNNTIYRNSLHQVNLSNSWKSNPDVGTDEDEYDIPADPPGFMRSLSGLYARVDKSHIKHESKEDATTTSNESDVSQNTKETNDSCAIYDDPGEVTGQVRHQHQIKSEDAMEKIDIEKYLYS